MKIFRPLFAVYVSIVLEAVLSNPTPASALDAELAKKCREAAIKSHPMALPGAKTGTAQAERDAYRACIANNGVLPDNDMRKSDTPIAK